jgi:predicted enzyme related to lactoylglutathione lyase
MRKRNTYPVGVPCWVDVVQPDVDAAKAFYGGLFGWTFEQRTPPGAPQQYFYARLEGLLVGGLGGPPLQEGERPGWTAYVRVDSADAAADRVVAAGGQVLVAPVAVGPPGRPTGRSAVFADPAGAVIGAWEPVDLHGSELVNEPGSWNFSDLQVGDVDGVKPFYADVFGWELDVLDTGRSARSGMWRRPGYGDLLAADDPALRERQAQAPPGFADAVALVGFARSPADPDRAFWGTLFSVADADEALVRATLLGATEVAAITQSPYTRSVTVRDPQGTDIVLNQYLPPR